MKAAEREKPWRFTFQDKGLWHWIDYVMFAIGIVFLIIALIRMHH